MSARAAGDPIPAGCQVIAVHVADLRQMFNAMDPSPFYERDLDPDAEEFIESWAAQMSSRAPIGLVVTLDRAGGEPSEADVLRTAVQQHFRRRAQDARRRLRALFQRGRVSLAIGLAFLGLSSWIASNMADVTTWGVVLREGVIIGGWVAMWRPLELLLYDWWPIRAEARRHDRLASMPVRIQYAGTPAGKP